jgi:CheY-like chemotaxis protein
MTNVILVDDDRTSVNLVKMLLELDGYQVTVCYDIASAKAAVKAETDAIIVDYHLRSGDNGLELVRAIRAGETAAARHTLTILTTGDQRKEQEAEEAGVDKFMLKPYPPSALSKIINELLALKKQ